MKKIYTAALVICSLGLAKSQVYETVDMGFMTDVSNNGVAVGNVMYGSHIMWTEAGGTVVIGEPASGAQIGGTTNVTIDGKFISGTMTNTNTMGEEMALYNVETGQWKYLGALVPGQEVSAWGMTSDGSTVVGLGFVSSMEAHAVKWTQEGGLVDLGSTFPETSSRANGINDDGTIIVGCQDDDFDRFGAYWKNGVQHLLKNNDGENVGEIFAVTPDGKTMIGANYDWPYIWKETDGYLELPHEDPMYIGGSIAVTDDGKKVLGFYRPWGQSAFSGNGFIWTKENGVVDLNDYVQSLGVDAEGMTFSLPLGMSPNGKYIVGIGTKNDENLGFVIKLPDSALATNNVKVSKSAIYPNPVVDVLNITNADKLENLEVYNFAGQKVLATKTIKDNKLNVSQLAKGAYILKVTKNGVTESIKFVKE